MAVAAATVAVVAAGWLVAEEARYKRPGELDARPYPLRRVDLEPPAIAGGIEYYGKLRAELYIGGDGAVDRIEVLEATLPAAIAEKMLKAFAASRWEPARRWGLRTRSLTVVEVDIPPPAGARPPMRPDS